MKQLLPSVIPGLSWASKPQQEDYEDGFWDHVCPVFIHMNADIKIYMLVP